MNAPLDRDTQIKLMSEAKERIDAQVEKWLRERTVLRTLREADSDRPGHVHELSELKVVCR